MFDRSDRARWRFTGPKAAELITGLVTNDVLALRPGDGQYAAALTPKGRIVADLRIFAAEDGLLIDTGAAAAAGWAAMVRKFVNPRMAPFTDISAEARDLGVFGAGAAGMLSKLLEIPDCDLEQLRPYAHVRTRTRSSGADATVVRAAELGDVQGFDVFVAAEAYEPTREELLSVGAAVGTRAAFDVARIEAGFPLWGVDMNEDTLAQEANLDELGAISYSKGCYVGQEVVARIHFRGHVNKMLRRVRFTGDPMPARGAELLDETGKSVGDLRSVALSPGLGGVGIAMVRREFGAGTTLGARWDGGSAAITIAD